MIQPNLLKKGDKIALVCTSSAMPDNTRLELGLKAVRALGLEPIVYPSCKAVHGYLAGTDAVRAKDINDAFADDNIKGILCARGGYGSHRILPLLDFDTIKKHPKPLFGYSDVTGLHTALTQVCGFISYHTMMPTTEYYKEVDDYSMEYLKKALFGTLEGFIENPKDQAIETLCEGKATGVLCGGNLSLLVASLGTPWEINTKGKILFLEDVDESSYRIDSFLTHMRNAGKFEDASGIILGGWTNCEPKDPERGLFLPQIFNELVVPAKKPTIANFACGHVLPTCSLPFGATVTLDATAKTLEVHPCK